MSPLLLVGLLTALSPCFADVKHVLEGSARPPNAITPGEINCLAHAHSPSNHPSSGALVRGPDGNYPITQQSPQQQQAFWWADADSPFKQAYEHYKRCSQKGNCAPAPPQTNSVDAPAASLPRIDVQRNPFLNGQFSGASFAGASFGGCQGGACRANTPDLSRNPFLQFGKKTATSVNGEPINAEEGFLGVQPVQPFSGNKKPFPTKYPGGEQSVNQGAQPFPVSRPTDADTGNKKPFPVERPQQQDLGGSVNANPYFKTDTGGAKGLSCKDAGFICVDREMCVNGIVDSRAAEGLLEVGKREQYCDVSAQTCCQLQQPTTPNQSKLVNALNDITEGKNSIPGSTIKFNGGAGFSPGTIQVLPEATEPRPVITYGGAKPPRDVSSSSSNSVDFSNVGFADSRFQGPAYLPPVEAPSPSTPKPYYPTGTPQQPSPSSPSGFYSTSTTTQAPFPSTERTTFNYNNQYVTPKQPQQPSPSTYRPYTTTPSPTTASREYLPPQQPSQPPYRPSGTPPAYVPPSQSTYVPPYNPPSSQPPYKPSGTPPAYVPPSQSTYVPPYNPPSSQTPYRPYSPPPTTSPATYTPPRQPPYSPPSQPPYSPPSQPPYRPPSQPPTYAPPSSQPPYAPSTPSPATYLPPGQPSYGTPSPPRQPPFSASTPSPSTYVPPGQPSYGPPSPPTYVPPTYRPYPSPSTPSPSTYVPPRQPSTSYGPPSPSQTPYRPYSPPSTPSPPQQPSSTYVPQSPSPSTYVPPRQPSTSYGPPSQPPYKPYSPPSTPSPPTYIPPSQPTYSPPSSSQPPYSPSSTAPPPSYTPPRQPSTPYVPPYSPPAFTRPSPTPPKPPVTNQYLPPSTRPPYQPSPTSPRPSVTYQYPSPTSPKPSVTYQYPSPSTPPPSQPTPSSPFYRPPSPSGSSQVYVPTTTPRPRPPSPSRGYEYNRPTPAFEYPTPSVDNTNINNQYLYPKPPPTVTDSSIVRISVIPPDNVPNEGKQYENRVTKRPPAYNGEQNTAPPAGCAAALKCVQEIYCSADGVISPVPVILTKEQELARVPTTVCADHEAGIIGKCCRDPNYVDPWPSANLLNGVDNGQYKEDPNLGQYQPQKQRSVRSGPRASLQNPTTPQQFVNPSQDKPTCGERHFNTQPRGQSKLDVNFAEIPWQAMILRETNRSLLCGGVIIKRDVVLTAAHCVHGLETSDVLIKGGEWKLGIDEEPLPFQIVKVSVIVRHPDYTPGSFVNDLALLFLDEKLRLAKNIGTICLPKPNEIPTANCIATGWGKRILQLHAKGALMHSIDVNIMPPNQCQQALSEKYSASLPNYSPNTLCGFSNIDQCKVDYGSALACSSGDGSYTLSGIYAWDTGCRDASQIGGYVAPDVEWIDSCAAKSQKELRALEREYKRRFEN